MADTIYVQPGNVNSSGIHIPSYNEIFQGLISGFRDIYGLSDTDSLTNPNNPDVQYLAMVAISIYDSYALAVSNYNSFSPQTAQGVGLSQIVQINGITRKQGTHSLCDVFITGTPGTSVTNGKAKDALGQTWIVPPFTIGVGGSITVTATAQDEGAITCPIGSITKIVTPTRGWVTIINNVAPSIGLNTESDAELRQRQMFSTALSSTTLLDGMKGNILNLNNVSYVRIYENDTNVVDTNGLVPHSIAVVVEGGDSTEIANIIFLKKTMGCATNGDVDITITDSMGVDHLIHFYRPTLKPIQIEIELRDLGGFVSTIEDVIKDNLVNYIKRLTIGEDVIRTRLYGPILASEPDPTTQTFDIFSLKIDFVGGTPTEQNLSVGFNGLATLDINDIIISVVP